MTTTADYVGRKVDLLAFHGYDSGDPSAPLEQSLAPDGTGGAVVAGVEKLAQRFLVELLTERGSLPYAAARGCSILSEARQGGWRSAGDVTRSFYSSLVDVRRTLLGLESDSDPDDERYASAELLGVDLTGDSVVLRVSLSSRAGTSRVVLPPLPLTP